MGGTQSFLDVLVGLHLVLQPRQVQEAQAVEGLQPNWDRRQIQALSQRRWIALRSLRCSAMVGKSTLRRKCAAA